MTDDARQRQRRKRWSRRIKKGGALYNEAARTKTPEFDKLERLCRRRRYKQKQWEHVLSEVCDLIRVGDTFEAACKVVHARMVS